MQEYDVTPVRGLQRSAQHIGSTVQASGARSKVTTMLRRTYKTYKGQYSDRV
jgi:hypothetical protein